MVETRGRELRPLARAVKIHVRRMQVPLVATSMLVAGAPPGVFAEDRVLEEVVVTATKRESNLQDVPLSLQVLSEQTLDELNIANFDDYINFLPSVSTQSVGPGQATIYMRGVSTGGDGNFSGVNPSVAVYLDEQPVTAIGRNLDVHIYDVARIESVAGPQGTLFGASSQAGTLRIITNQPDTNALYGGLDIGVATTEDGSESYSFEGFLNIPVSDNVAIRLVGFAQEDGGWIDEVPASITFPGSGISVSNSGNPDPNHNQVKSDTNDLSTQGLRAALGINLSENWSAVVSVIHQSHEADGLFADQQNSAVGEGNIERFYNDESEDEWTQYGITLKGDVDFAELTLTASTLDREVSYDIDYTAYSAFSSYVEYYYTCDNYAFENCVDPRMQYEQDSDYKRHTFELRAQSQGDGRIGWVAGIFYEENKHEYSNKWHIPPIAATGKAINTLSARGETDLYFATIQERNDEETAFFGEISYQFTDKLSALAGFRSFDHEGTLEGFTGSFFSCFDPVTGDRLGPGTPSSPNCGGGLKHDEQDETYKFNVTYDINDNLMVYGTYSEGFRPGGANRFETPAIPAIYNSDKLKNYEFGWKSMLFNGTLRFNGAIYRMYWEDVQFTRFDPTVSFVGLTANAGEAEINGFEADVHWAPTSSITLRAAISYNDAKLTKDYARDTTPGATPDAPDGTDLPFTPDLKYTISGRFNFGNDMYSVVSYSYTDDSFNDLFPVARVKQDDYAFLNASFGIQRDQWRAEVYINNITNESAELFINSRGGDNRVTTNRPRNAGVRFSYSFD